MKLSRWIQKTTFAILFAFFAIGQAPTWADGEGGPDQFIHTRTYLGLMGTSVSVGNKGEFSGTLYSWVNNPNYEVNLIPALSQSFGFAAIVGHREEAYAAEVSFWQSVHQATFGPVNLTASSGMSSNFTATAQDTAVYNSINVDFKRYFLTEMNIQPFLNLGVSFPWIVVSNSASDVNGNIGSTSISGLGVNVGVGAEWYLDNHFSLTASVVQRWASFDQFRGFVDSQYAPLALNGPSASDDGSGLDFMIGTTVGFY